MQRPAPGADTALVFAGALLLFGTTATAFEARVTDLSALRVLNGEVPYRDFWTIYAPGSFVTLALAFALFGRQLIVSNVLGVVTAAAGVAAYYRLARPLSGAGPAALMAMVVGVTYYGTGYHDGFTSYPPACLLLLLAVERAAAAAGDPDWRRAVAPGLLVGLAALFKHDVAGYTAIAMGVALTLTRRRAGGPLAWAPALVVVAVAGLVVAIAAGVLAGLGAGHDMWIDLVRFPLTDFRYVRTEFFPLVPRLGGPLVDSVRGLRIWSVCNAPTIALAFGLLAIRRGRRSLDAPTRFAVTFAFVAFCFHWWAAHVQINTNAISLAAWGGLVGAIGLREIGGRPSTAAQPVSASAPSWTWGRVSAPLTAWALVTAWTLVLLTEPVYAMARSAPSPSEWVGLPRLHGIRAVHDDAVWMRELAAAMAAAADPQAPLLFLSGRNDMTIFASSAPFWLTDRRAATRHHELHPGITDTEPVQRQMLAQIARGVPPVVVREFRFDDERLDATKARILPHVAVGSTLIDAWVDAHYASAPACGIYEVMRPR